MDYMSDLHELCETVGRAITSANEKIRTAGGKVSNADMEYIDKLTHSLKSIKSVMAMIEEEEGSSERGSYDGSYARGGRGSSRRGGGSYDGGSYEGGSYDGSYARGRYARRDSMGRFSRDGGSMRGGGGSRDGGSSRDGGYSRDGDMIEELRELMQDAPDQKTRQEFQRFIEKMEQQMQ